MLPPGDLRMALAALCGDDEWGQTWAGCCSTGSSPTGEMHGHAVGNLLIVALWELLGDDHVDGLDWVGRLLGARGRVLPMATTPLDITAVVRGSSGRRPDELTTVRGQVEVATTPGCGGVRRRSSRRTPTPARRRWRRSARPTGSCWVRGPGTPA